MRYSLRTALAAILTFVSVGTSFGAAVVFNPGTDSQVASNGFNSALVLSHVTIYPGATLDLTNGGMVVDANNYTYYAPNGVGGYVAETGTLAVHDSLANMVGTEIRGQPGVSGDQTNGVFSSANVAGNPNFAAYAENSQIGYSNWRNVDLTQSAVTSMGDPTLIGYAYAGDIYMQGFVDSGELSTVAGNYTNQVTGTSWIDGDIYYQGFVDSGSLSTVAGNYTNNPSPLYTAPFAAGGPVSPPSAAGSISAVPEPSTFPLVLASVGFGLMFLRRGLRR